MSLILIFIFGLLVGSFLNVVIFRLQAQEPFLFGRSHCNSCKKALSAKDLIPLVSFIFLRGRCRYCQGKISWQYPIVELTTAITFCLLVLNFEFRISNFEFWFQVVMAGFLIVIAVYDLKHYLILDKVLLPALGLAVVWNLVSGSFISGLAGGILISGFFGLQYLISRGRWMGWGDVKLGLLLGFLAGWPQSLVLLMLAYFSGALAGLMLIILGKKKFSSKLPFGTFLAFSAIITMLLGNSIMNWYLKLIGL